MKKFVLPLVALVAGFIGAFLTAGVHSLYFVLLPIMAFIFGYFTFWRRGLLCGFLLFAGYAFAISLIWREIDIPNLFYPIPYISAFVYGGFGILLIGVLAPVVRKGLRKASSIAVLVILILVVGWCGYSALPSYGYYHQVSIESSEDLKDIEIYMPAAAVSGEPWEELYSHVFQMSGLTQTFTQEIVKTEYGPMVKLNIPYLRQDDVKQPRYTANIIFWQKNAPRKLIQFMPKSKIIEVNWVTSQHQIGPVKGHEYLVLERFIVPLKITADKSTLVKFTLTNRTDRSEAVNFTYTKTYPYTERISYDLQTGNNWTFIPAEANILTNISGISD